MPLMQYNVLFAEYYAKKRAEGKSHRVACTHTVKELTRDIDFDPEKLR